MDDNIGVWAVISMDANKSDQGETRIDEDTGVGE